MCKTILGAFLLIPLFFSACNNSNNSNDSSEESVIISDLTVSAGTLSPEFSSTVTEYTMTVANADDSLTLTFSLPNSSFVVTINETEVTDGEVIVPLEVGDNELTVVVSNQEQTTTTTYHLVITRLSSTDASLSDLKISFSGTDLDLQPDFAAGTLSYETLMPTGDSLTVTATANQDAATLEVRINEGAYAPLTSGVASGALTTELGENVIEVRVTAQDESIQTYTTTVHNQYAYITNATSYDIIYCAIDADRQFTDCEIGTTGLGDPTGLSFNPNRTSIYFPDLVGNTVTVCDLQSNGSMDNCVDAATGFMGPSSVALSPDGVDAYVTNINSNTISHCIVNEDGTFSNCVNTGSGFNSPFSIDFNETGTFVYVSNWGSNDISYCAVGDDGSLSNCLSTASSAGLDLAGGVTFAPSGNRAYMANNGSTDIIFCEVEDDGSFSNCSQAVDGFSSPIDVAIDLLGLYAYVTHYDASTIEMCTIEDDGTFSDCIDTGSGFDGPIAIDIR